MPHLHNLLHSVLHSARFRPLPPSPPPLETPRFFKVLLKYHRSNTSFSKNPLPTSPSSALPQHLSYTLLSSTMTAPAFWIAIVFRKEKEKGMWAFNEDILHWRKNSEESPITFGWITKRGQITRAGEFSGLSENYSYAFGSIIIKRAYIICFMKAITWNFHVESHFYNKYNPISRRGESKIKVINSFPQSILLHRF